jgi:hypothetical protein
MSNGEKTHNSSFRQGVIIGAIVSLGVALVIAVTL